MSELDPILKEKRHGGVSVDLSDNIGLPQPIFLGRLHPSLRTLPIPLAYPYTRKSNASM
jgi:hypothetical protein